MFTWQAQTDVVRGPAGPAMVWPLFSWLYTKQMEQYSLARPVIHIQSILPDKFSAWCDAPARLLESSIIDYRNRIFQLNIQGAKAPHQIGKARVAPGNQLRAI